MGGVPSIILPDPVIYLGGSDVLDDEHFFRDNRITGCLSVCDASIKAHVQRKLEAEFQPIDICHIKVTDSIQSNLLTYFEEIVEFVFKIRQKSFSTESQEWDKKQDLGGMPANSRTNMAAGMYIHCQAGISRSTTSCCAYLMTYFYPMTFREAIGHCHRCRDVVCPNDSFREQLLAWEKDTRRRRLHEEMKVKYPRQFEIDFMQRDVAFIVQKLQDCENSARELSETKWVYVCDGNPVPREYWSEIVEDLEQSVSSDPYEKTYILNSRDKDYPQRVMLKKELQQDSSSGDIPSSSKNGTQEAPGDCSEGLHTDRVKNWSLEDFDEQKRRLRERFQGMESCEDIGLTWLLEST